MSTLKVYVTQSDIDEGGPQEPRSCPVALAFERAWTSLSPHLIDLSVNYTTIEVTLDDEEEIMPQPHAELSLPLEARDFIHDFDSDVRSVGPFEFVVEIPDELVDA